ncbi:MAG TPA: hypothetical protein EYG04_01325 [Candidatus Poseidoniales archaeon]|nr:hypothetical protein [Candidatus Poseidoniales archaeon]
MTDSEALPQKSDTSKSVSHTGDSGDENSQASGVVSGWRQWIKEESDHQWLSLVIFVFAILIGAQMIVSASVTPGLNSTDYNSQESSIIDMEWNDDYSMALLLVNSHGEKQVEAWDGVNRTPLAFDGGRTITSWQGGWLIGGDDGALGRCLVTCSTITPINLEWNGSSIGQHIIGISTSNGDSGLLLIHSTSTDDPDELLFRSPSSVVIRAFNSTHVGPASEVLSSDISLTAISSIDETTYAIGSGWFSSNPALTSENGVIAEVIGGDTENAPQIQLRHIGPALYHTILANAASGEFVVVGDLDSVVISPQGTLEIVDEMNGANAATMDSEGNVWMAGALSSDFIQYIPANEKVAVSIQIKSTDLDVSLMSYNGEVVLLHGTDASGSADMEFNIDASKNTIVPSNFSRLLFIIFGSTLVVMKVWSIWARVQYNKQF